jgi:putative FmdB family regulatory protein
MPTYQYKCRECGEDLEVVQSFSDDALTTCPSCNGSLRKIFSAVGISFKGSGFYANDARGSRSSTTAPAASSEASSGDSTSGSTSDGSSTTSTSTSASDTSSSKSTTSSDSTSGSTSSAAAS